MGCIALVSDGEGTCYFFNVEQREEILAGRLDYYAESHTSIADFYGFKGVAEDSLNKYIYLPVSRKLFLQQLNTKDDTKQVNNFCDKMDFKEFIPFLNHQEDYR